MAIGKGIEHVADARNLDSFMSGVLSAKHSSDLVIAGYALEKAVQALDLGGDWSQIKDLPVVDLGCGSRRGNRAHVIGGWVPYYCLLTANLEAQVTGVDLYPADPKDAQIYHHIQANIVDSMNTGSFASLGIRDNSISVVNTNLFTGTEPPSRDLRKTLDDQRISESLFDEAISIMISRVLVHGGVWIENAELRFRK